MKICIHQFMRPKYSALRPAGKGDCSICEKSPENSNCTGYFSINISIIDVEDKDYAKMR